MFVCTLCVSKHAFHYEPIIFVSYLPCHLPGTNFETAHTASTCPYICAWVHVLHLSITDEVGYINSTVFSKLPIMCEQESVWLRVNLHNQNSMFWYSPKLLLIVQLLSNFCFLFFFFLLSFSVRRCANVSVTSAERFVTSVTWRYSFLAPLLTLNSSDLNKKLKKKLFLGMSALCLQNHIWPIYKSSSADFTENKLCCKLDALYVNSWVKHRKNSQNSWKCLTPGHIVTIMRTW